MGKREEGQAMVELALVLPILLLLLMGIIEFGRIFNTYLTVAHASREAARVAAVGQSDSQITTVAINRAVNLDSRKLTVKVTPEFSSRTRGTAVKVEVDYPLPLIVPLIANIAPNPFPISAQTIMREE